MITETLQQLLEQSFEDYLRLSTKKFLEGHHSFRWITGFLSRSGLQKEEVDRLLLPLRNHGDSFRSAALFSWLEKAEWQSRFQLPPIPARRTPHATR
jgi:hypothetical protein